MHNIIFISLFIFISSYNLLASKDHEWESDKKPINKSVYFDEYQRLPEKILNRLRSGRVKTCYIESAPLTTDEVKLISSNTGIRHLSVIGCDIKADDWNHLGAITNLKSLNISHNSSVPVALKELKNLNSVESFGCAAIPLTDELLSEIKVTMPKLRGLDVSACGLSDSALDVLLSFPHLKKVSLSRNNFSETALKNFRMNAAKKLRLIKS